MGKERFQLDIVRPGALIKFKDDSYGFLRGEEIEKVDEQTLEIDGHEVSSVYIKYLNDLQFSSREGMEEWAEAARTGLGEAIRNERERLDIYQKDLSVSQWTASLLEQGKRMPEYKTIKKIANDLDLSFAELLSKASLEMWREISDE